MLRRVARGRATCPRATRRHVVGSLAGAAAWLAIVASAIGQFTGPIPPTGVPDQTPVMIDEKRVQILPRGSTPIQFETFTAPESGEQITVVNSGVHIVIDGLSGLGTVDISSDRLVIWAAGDISSFGNTSEPVPVEFYLEGNVVFRQADRVIYASSMFYNVAQDQGIVMNSELLVPVTDFQGLVRLKAAILRQRSSSDFEAFGAAVTSSRLGVPRYWFQSERLSLIDTTGQGFDDLLSGQIPTVGPTQGVTGERRVTSRNNFVYLGGVPIFFWPVLTTDFTRPSIYIERVRFGNDRVFGRLIGADVDLDQLFALGNRFPNFDWALSIDYLSKRGWGLGTHVDYEADSILGFNGPAKGFLDAWGIAEQGFDNLGRDRLMLTPETDSRGRILGRHRQRLWNGWQVTGQAGYISDRNFLEQYYELEWDQEKDQVTGVEFKRLAGTSSLTLSTYGRLNPFFTQTEWYPRADHIELGRDLAGQSLTWLGHSQIGYAHIRPASAPLDPDDADTWNPLAWDVDRQGVRVGGRHELDFPFQWGATKIVPYVLGDVMYWGQDLSGNDVTRLYGQAGVRASLPMWRVDPTVQSLLFNLNGLAHKVVWEAEFLYADADQNLDIFPLYDPLDDDSQEHFRRRFVDDDFGGMPVPLQFDSRYFALRTGMQSWVTAPSAEIADDLMLLRLGVRQRWQTKRGVPGQFRTVDWITLNAGGTIFPNPERDDFGAPVGLINYDARWHIGDRLTLTSDGFADAFGQGLRTVTLGGYLSRPERGTLYAGVRSIEGPITSTLLDAALNYRMSPKWIGTAAASVDLGPAGNIGQLYEVTRVGESFFVSLGAIVDPGRDNLGFRFMVEPRFLPFSQRSRIAGVPIPPAGAFGLE